MEPDSKPLLAAIFALGIAAFIAIAQDINQRLRG